MSQRFKIPHWLYAVLLTSALFLNSPGFAESGSRNVSLEQIQKTSHFQDSDAEIIKKHVTVNIDKDYLTTSQSYVAIKINNSSAIQDFSQLIIEYNNFYENVELLYARTIDQDGSRKELDLNAVQVQTPPSRYFYKDTRHLVFSVPSLKQGSIIEYEFKRQSIKPFIPNYYGEDYHFYFWHKVLDQRGFRFDPVRLSQYQINFDDSLDIDFKLFNNKKSIKYKKSRSKGKISYFLEAKDISGLALQPNMQTLNDFLPYASFTSLKDWKQIQDWAGALFIEQQTVSDQVRELAVKIKTDHETDAERVRAVYEMVNRKIRYIYSHVGRGGFTPHSPSEILKNGYGDCKDQTMLAVVLLNEMGIDAYPALINTRRAMPFKPDDRKVRFDHMIVYLPGDYLGTNWLDTTSDNGQFPGAMSYADNRPALILNKTGVGFVNTPARTAEKDSLDIDVEFSRYIENAIEGKIEIRPQGSFEEYYRKVWQFETEEKKRVLVEALVKSVFPTAEIKSYNSINYQDLFRGIEINADFRIDNIWENEKKSFTFSTSLPYIWKQILSPQGLISPENRRVPLSLIAEYGLNVTMNVKPPASEYFVNSITQGVDLKNDYLKLTQSSEIDEYGVTILMNAVFKKKNTSLADYLEYIKAYDDFLKSPQWLMRYSKDESRFEKEALELSAATSIDSGNDLIQYHLDNGEFEQALKLAGEITTKDNANARSYYLLGLSQAYNGLDDEATISFEKAEVLGYEL